MPYGYTGNILRVNLSTGAMTTEHPEESFYRRYFGGWGIIGYYLLKELAPGVDPLGPDNKLIWAIGPLTGAPFVGNDRSAVGAKSPLTGGFGVGEAGGWWPAELKHAGFDAIIVEGVSPKPVYLWVHDGEAEIRDAAHLWGKGMKETQDTLRAELGDARVRVSGIGPGGENMARIACIMNGLIDSHGRTGMGAVMGSKRLKAVACRGHKQPELADPDKLREMNRWMVQNNLDLNFGLYTNGTADGIPGLQAGSGLPTRNFQSGVFDQYMNLAGETVTKTVLIKRENCYACSVQCKRVVKTESPYANDPAFGGPEYETTASLGSLCGVGDISAVSYGNQLCNDYSLDTIGAGVCVAFAMECFENGIITTADTGGLDLHFGNADAMVKLIPMIAKREGIGADLAEGIYKAAQKWGKGAIKFAMQVKGQEFPMHEPRYKQALGIGYAVSPTGADHVHNLHDSGLEREGKDLRNLRIWGPFAPMALNNLGPEKVRALKYNSNMCVIDNSLVICLFPNWKPDQVADITRAVTGWNTSLYELEMMGERCVTLARIYNLREGFTAADDTLPERMFTPFHDGPRQGTAVSKRDWEEAKHIYYGMMGWDEATGVPRRSKLQELDIEWAADLLPGGAK